MRKKMLIVVCSVISALLATAFVKLNCYSESVHTFNLDDYKAELSEFSTEERCGPITTTKDAVVAAETIWNRVYGESTQKQKPYKVYYDEENKVWLVHGTAPFAASGGVAYFIVEENTGKVLAVWHEK